MFSTPSTTSILSPFYTDKVICLLFLDYKQLIFWHTKKRQVFLLIS
nr:MAG TPA: hypothetical protein [Caudoviricetes sp.]